jgi:hypothetical protein
MSTGQLSRTPQTPVLDRHSSPKGECPVQVSSPLQPSPQPHALRPLAGRQNGRIQPDIREAIVAALAETLVAEFERDTAAMGNSPGGPDHG